MNKITLYNRISIFIFSIVLSLIGALMFAYNLRAINKNNIVWPIVIITLLTNAGIRYVMKHLVINSYYTFFVPNLIIAIILVLPVWNKYFGEIHVYKSKNIWIPLTSAVVLYGGIMLLVHLIK